MVEYDRNQQSELGGRPALRICVAGVGGAGSNVLKSITLDRLTMDSAVEASLVSFQTDVRVLNHWNCANKVQLGAELMRGVGAGGDPDLGREAAMFSKDQIHAAVEGHDMVFISVGLGGGTGSGAAPVIAEIAKSTGATVLVFAAVPFSFEGRRRHQQATDALERLQKYSDALVLFDNSRMGELVLPKDGIQKAFSQADQLIAQSVRAVTGMIGAPGIVKLGLDDLVSALRTNEGRCLFGFGEAKGQNRGVDALKKALKSPLINQGQLLQNAKNLLVHIVGGESLTLAEVEVVMKQLGRHVPDETQILFGIGVEPKLGESVTVTLVSSLSATELASRPAVEPEAERQPAPVRAPVSRAPVAAPAPVVDDATMPLFAEEPAEPEPAPAPVQAPAPIAKRPSAAMQSAIASVPPPPAELFAAAPPAPAPEPQQVQAVAAPAPAARPRVVQEAPPPPPPPPAPEPVAEEPEFFEEEEEPEPMTAEAPDQLVYSAAEAEAEAEEEEQDDYHPVAAAPAPAPAPVSPPPSRDTKGFKLSSVLDSMPSMEPAAAPKSHPGHLVDEIFIEATESNTPVVKPVAETAAVPLPRPAARPSVAPAATTIEHIVVSQTTSVSVGEESDLFGNSPPPMQMPANVNTRKQQPVAEQQSLRLGGNEDRGRFKDTEPAVVQGEDLDTPTWMRLRRRVAR